MMAAILHFPKAPDVAGGCRFSLRVEINRCQTILPRFELVITNSSWPLPAQHHFRRRLEGLVRRSQSRSRETLMSKVRDPSSPASLAKTPWGLGQASRLETTRDVDTFQSPKSELQRAALASLKRLPCPPPELHLERRGPAGPRDFENKSSISINRK